jgi:hypothetical protein
VSPGGELTCERDRTTTRLTCVQCAIPICPQCLVRTPVGLKCPTCGAERPRGGHVTGRRLSWAVPAVVAFVLLAVIGLPRLFSSKPTSSSSSTANPLAETVPPTLGVAGPELRARYARIGQESRDGDLAFTVSAMDCGATHLPGAAAARVAQGLFCFVSIDVKNFGRAPANFLGRLQMVLDEQSRRFGPDPSATQAYPDNGGQDLTQVVVNPGNELKAVLVFDVPNGTVPVVAALRSTPRGPGTYVNLV